MGMQQNEQVCAIATRSVYEQTLRDDGRLWGECSAAGVWFRWDSRPLDMAIKMNERNGIATYPSRVG